jgi:hypothetical protein
MFPAGNWSEIFKESSRNSFGITYMDGMVALEGAVMDLDIGTKIRINSSGLEIVHVPRREL